VFEVLHVSFCFPEDSMHFSQIQQQMKQMISEWSCNELGTVHKIHVLIIRVCIFVNEELLLFEFFVLKEGRQHSD
jgi:hypothetical protein